MDSTLGRLGWIDRVKGPNAVALHRAHHLWWGHPWGDRVPGPPEQLVDPIVLSRSGLDPFRKFRYGLELKKRTTRTRPVDALIRPTRR